MKGLPQSIRSSVVCCIVCSSFVSCPRPTLTVSFQEGPAELRAASPVVDDLPGRPGGGSPELVAMAPALGSGVAGGQAVGDQVGPLSVGAFPRKRESVGLFFSLPGYCSFFCLRFELRGGL